MPTPQSPQFETVCRLEELAEGHGRLVVVADRQIGLFRVAGRVYAIDNVCPHAGASLAHGFTEGHVVTCRVHHWRFSLRDGHYLDEDKPRCNLTTFPVRVRDGEVQVSVE